MLCHQEFLDCFAVAIIMSFIFLLMKGMILGVINTECNINFRRTRRHSQGRIIVKGGHQNSPQ